MKNTKINLALFNALFIDKNPKFFKFIKKMNSFSKAMSKTRYDSYQIEENDRTILENIYIEELNSTLSKFEEQYPNSQITTERADQVAKEIRFHVKNFFDGAVKDKIHNLDRIETNFDDSKQSWGVRNTIGRPELDLDNPGNNKLFWNDKEVDGELISEFIKITENTKTKSRRDVQIRLLDFNFGVSAEENIPVKFLFHFINKNYRNKNIRKTFKLRRPPIEDYIDKLIQTVTSKNYRDGDWIRWIQSREQGFELSYIPRFWDYLDSQQEE